MSTRSRWYTRYAFSFGLILTGLCGCQTYVPGVGMTLPSGRYLEHPPQYIPQSPPFPLSRELARQEEVAIQAQARQRGYSLTPTAAPAPVVPPATPTAPAPAPAPVQPPAPER